MSRATENGFVARSEVNMSFESDLRSDVSEFFRTKWEITDGYVIPDPEDLPLGNSARKLDIVILYADMANSTSMVQTFTKEYCAEIYKAFLHTCCKAIKRNGGELISFDGDRIMAAFIGESKNSIAAKTALNIKWAIKVVVQEEHDRIYQGKGIKLNYCVGIDSCEHIVARTGIRGDNDLVWVGNAANLAAKLSTIRDAPNHSYITERVYKKLNESSKFDGEGKCMWQSEFSSEIGETVYKSSYQWTIN